MKRHFTKYLSSSLQKHGSYSKKGRLRNCHRLKQSKETKCTEMTELEKRDISEDRGKMWIKPEVYSIILCQC